MDDGQISQNAIVENKQGPVWCRHHLEGYIYLNSSNLFRASPPICSNWHRQERDHFIGRLDFSSIVLTKNPTWMSTDDGRENEEIYTFWTYNYRICLQGDRTAWSCWWPIAGRGRTVCPPQVYLAKLDTFSFGESRRWAPFFHFSFQCLNPAGETEDVSLLRKHRSSGPPQPMKLL